MPPGVGLPAEMVSVLLFGLVGRFCRFCRVVLGARRSVIGNQLDARYSGAGASLFPQSDNPSARFWEARASFSADADPLLVRTTGRNLTFNSMGRSLNSCCSTGIPSLDSCAEDTALAGCSTQECGLFDLQRSRKAVVISIATSVPAIKVVSQAGAYHGEILILLQHKRLVTCNEMCVVGTEVVK